MMDYRFEKSCKDVRILRWNYGKRKMEWLFVLKIKQEMRCNSKLIKSNAPKTIIKEIYYYQFYSLLNIRSNIYPILSKNILSYYSTTKFLFFVN